MSRVYKSFDDLHFMPLHALILDFHTDAPYADGRHVEYRFLEEDSKWGLKSITRANDEGGLRTVAFRIEATAIVMFDKYEQMQQDLRNIARGTVLKASLELVPLDGQVHGRRMSIKMNQSITRKKWSASFDIEPITERPRLMIRLNGLFSIDAIDATNDNGLFATPEEVSLWADDLYTDDAPMG